MSVSGFCCLPNWASVFEVLSLKFAIQVLSASPLYNLLACSWRCFPHIDWYRVHLCHGTTWWRTKPRHSSFSPSLQLLVVLRDGEFKQAPDFQDNSWQLAGLVFILLFYIINPLLYLLHLSVPRRLPVFFFFNGCDLLHGSVLFYFHADVCRLCKFTCFYSMCTNGSVLWSSVLQLTCQTVLHSVKSWCPQRSTSTTPSRPNSSLHRPSLTTHSTCVICPKSSRECWWPSRHSSR